MIDEWYDNLNVRLSLRTRIYGILGLRGLRRPRVVFTGCYPAVTQTAFYNVVCESVENDLITNEEYVLIVDSDMIARARRRGLDGWVYVAVQAAKRLNIDDVDKAVRTRQALATIFPKSEIRSMVYGVEISDDGRRHAESRGVETILEPHRWDKDAPRA